MLIKILLLLWSIGLLSNFPPATLSFLGKRKTKNWLVDYFVSKGYIIDEKGIEELLYKKQLYGKETFGLMLLLIINPVASLPVALINLYFSISIYKVYFLNKSFRDCRGCFEVIDFFKEDSEEVEKYIQELETKNIIKKIDYIDDSLKDLMEKYDYQEEKKSKKNKKESKKNNKVSKESKTKKSTKNDQINLISEYEMKNNDDGSTYSKLQQVSKQYDNAQNDVLKDLTKEQLMSLKELVEEEQIRRVR